MLTPPRHILVGSHMDALIHAINDVLMIETILIGLSFVGFFVVVLLTGECCRNLIGGYRENASRGRKESQYTTHGSSRHVIEFYVPHRLNRYRSESGNAPNFSSASAK